MISHRNLSKRLYDRLESELIDMLGLLEWASSKEYQLQDGNPVCDEHTMPPAAKTYFYYGEYPMSTFFLGNLKLMSYRPTEKIKPRMLKHPGDYFIFAPERSTVII